MENNSSKKNTWKKFLNIHVLFFVVFILLIGVIVYRFNNWGVKVDLKEIFEDGEGEYEDHFDEIVPLLDANYKPVIQGDVSDIVLFGNAPFADDRDSADNLANMIAEKTGATVYNCSVAGSYMATQYGYFDAQHAPMDAFCPYWLMSLAIGNPIIEYYEWSESWLKEDYPEEADEIIKTLTTLDFSQVDVIAFMYDATDYYMGNEMYSDTNPTDIQTFTGNLEASIELIQNVYPHIRIIVMSPTYAYAVDESGNYVSSDMYTYGIQDVLSTYVIKQYASCVTRNVSFMDNLYNSVTEANAEDYLIDNVHLNLEGRKLIADRFEYFLNYYTKGYGSK